MTTHAIVAAALLCLAPVGDGAADYNSAAVVSVSSTPHLAALLLVTQFRESRYSYAIETCREWHNPGRGAFQLGDDWGSLSTRCGPLRVQARVAARALDESGCNGSAWCVFDRYMGKGLHVREISERTGLYFQTLRRIEEKACVLP